MLIEGLLHYEDWPRMQLYKNDPADRYQDQDLQDKNKSQTFNLIFVSKLYLYIIYLC